MGKLDAYFDALYVVCERMRMVVLEFNGNLHLRAKREAQRLVGILCCHIVNVRDQHVKHHHLV